MAHMLSRRQVLGEGVAAALLLIAPAWSRKAVAAAPDEIARRFAFLSANGNSNCSNEFRDSIAAMPDGARLLGSCCGPMAEHRYREQIEGLKEFAGFSEIPPDPYDIDAAFAKRMMPNFELELSSDEQAVYDLASEVSAEKGPCCCKCWRWNTFGGMARLLIRDRGFDGIRVGQVWDLVDGCGGDTHAH